MELDEEVVDAAEGLLDVSVLELVDSLPDVLEDADELTEVRPLLLDAAEVAEGFPELRSLLCWGAGAQAVAVDRHSSMTIAMKAKANAFRFGVAAMK